MPLVADSRHQNKSCRDKHTFVSWPLSAAGMSQSARQLRFFLLTMAITRQKKEEILKELIDKFGKSKSVVFADYRGLDVSNISDLRNKLRAEDAEAKVAKKTLIGLAAKENKLDLDKSAMEGPVVATFSYEDPLSGIRILYQFSKKNENLKLLGGVVDGEVVGPDVIQKYAKLPSREELLAKFLGSINAPLSGFVGIGNSLVAGIVRALSAYKDTMPAEAAAPAAEAPKEEVKEEVKEEEKPAEEAKTEMAEAPAEEKDEAPQEEEEKQEESTS